MDIKKFVFGTLAGGLTYALLGFVVYGLLMESFFESHMASGLAKTPEQMKYYPLFAGNLAQGALLAYVFLKWANIKSFSDGLMAGAAIGFFAVAGFDLVVYDTAKIMSAVGTVTDIVVYTVLSGVAGGVVGAVLGMGNKS
jgi:uncharacterized membrane protein